MANVRTGACLCGAVKYEVTEDPLLAVHCHCSRCRRWAGAPMMTGMVVPSSQLRIVEGRDDIVSYRSDGFGTRSFCRTCGSNLFGGYWPDGAVAVVTLGTLSDDAGVEPQMHIHVASKAPWHRITDELPQLDGMPSM